MHIVRGLRAWVLVRAGNGCGSQGGRRGERNARESGEKDGGEASIRGDSREEMRERGGWAHRGTLCKK
jgi:hypothetical protein